MAIAFTDWNPNELYHYGIRGMKWGQRRFQNPDGSLTTLGQKRYGKSGYASASRMTKDLNKLDKERAEATYRSRQISRAKRVERLKSKLGKVDNAEKKAKIEKKIDKLTNGMSERRKAKVEGYNKLAEKSKQMADKILARAKESRYTVNSKLVRRAVYSNRDYVMTALGAVSAAGQAMTMAELTKSGFGVGVAPIFGGTATGTKYKVINKYTRRYRADDRR